MKKKGETDKNILRNLVVAFLLLVFVMIFLKVIFF